MYDKWFPSYRKASQLQISILMMTYYLPAAMNGDHFYPLLPDESPMSAQHEASPSPEKLARVHSPVAAPRAPPSQPAVPPSDRKTAMNPAEFAEKLMAVNEKQQTNVQVLIYWFKNALLIDL